MKKLMLLALLIVATLVVNAQRGGGNPEMRIDKRVAYLTEALDLSADQQIQVKDLFTQQIENRKAVGKKVREMSQEEREAFKAERKTAKADFENKMAAILTPAQNEQYQSLEKDPQRPNRGGAKGKATPEERTQKRVAHLTETLGLDADQQAAVSALFAKQAEKAKGQDWKSKSKEERKALKAEHKTAFEAELAEILTPEQMEAFQEMPKGKGKKKNKGKKRRNK